MEANLAPCTEITVSGSPASSPRADEMPEQYPGSVSMTSIASHYSACSSGSTSSTSSWVHNPYSLTRPMLEVGVEYTDEDEHGDPELSMHRGTMVLLTGDNGAEVVRSKAEVVQSLRRVYGYVDSETATPCGHLGRCRLRYKNSITHCRCRTCGMKWREIAFSRIRPEQMEDFQRSFTAAKSL